MKQDSSRAAVRWLAAILVGAFALRMAVVVLFASGLTEDRDGYLALAESLAEGRGFVRSDSGEPTAYRPPLYPFLIAALRIGGGSRALGAAQALLGTATVYLSWRLSRRYLAESRALLPAAIVAADPLLTRYTAFAMTETLFTALTTALLVTTTAPSPWCRRRAALVGALLGLSAMCRPTIWPWAAMTLAWATFTTWRNARRLTDASLRSQHLRTRLCDLAAIGLAAAAVVLPWTVRNWRTFGRPIVTTTHGGYTLLLANNPVVYREEVNRPWGVTWEQAPPGRRQEDWYAAVQDDLRRDLGPNPSEPAADRWMNRRALTHIRDDLASFARACLMRVRRLWNVAPLGPAATGIPSWLATAVRWHYIVLFALAIVGAARVARGVRGGTRSLTAKPSEAAAPDKAISDATATTVSEVGCGAASDNVRHAPSWAPLFLLLASFTLVHAVYWSNARMRAPLTPVVALLAAAGVGTLWDSVQQARRRVVAK